MNKCRVLLDSGEQCKKEQRKTLRIYSTVENLTCSITAKLIRPIKTALQCLIDQNYSKVVTALSYTAGYSMPKSY
jgi:hypothetical protein